MSKVQVTKILSLLQGKEGQRQTIRLVDMDTDQV